MTFSDNRLLFRRSGDLRHLPLYYLDFLAVPKGVAIKIIGSRTEDNFT